MGSSGALPRLTPTSLWSRRVDADAEPPLQPDDTARALGDRLEKAWQSRRDKLAHKAGSSPALPGQEASYAVAPADGKQKKQGDKEKRPNLAGALVSAFGGPFFLAAVFKVRLVQLFLLDPPARC